MEREIEVQTTKTESVRVCDVCGEEIDGGKHHTFAAEDDDTPPLHIHHGCIAEDEPTGMIVSRPESQLSGGESRDWQEEDVFFGIFGAPIVVVALLAMDSDQELNELGMGWVCGLLGALFWTIIIIGVAAWVVF